MHYLPCSTMMSLGRLMETKKCEKVSQVIWSESIWETNAVDAVKPVVLQRQVSDAFCMLWCDFCGVCPMDCKPRDGCVHFEDRQKLEFLEVQV
jgi:hypothetical protein